MCTSKEVVSQLLSLASPRKALELQRFFKTGPGDYAEGDIFLGIVVPKTRVVAKKYSFAEKSTVDIEAPPSPDDT
jgi:hypothetical protein